MMKTKPHFIGLCFALHCAVVLGDAPSTTNATQVVGTQTNVVRAVDFKFSPSVVATCLVTFRTEGEQTIVTRLMVGHPLIQEFRKQAGGWKNWNTNESVTSTFTPFLIVTHKTNGPVGVVTVLDSWKKVEGKADAEPSTPPYSEPAARSPQR